MALEDIDRHSAQMLPHLTKLRPLSIGRRGPSCEQFPGHYDQRDSDPKLPPTAAPAQLEPQPDRTPIPVPDPCAGAQSVWAALQNSSDEAALTVFSEGCAASCPTLAAQAWERLAELQRPKFRAACDSLVGVEHVNFQEREGNCEGDIKACLAAVDVFLKDSSLLHHLARAFHERRDYAEGMRWYRHGDEAEQTASMGRIG